MKKQGAQGALILDATIFALIRASSYGDVARIRAVRATGCIERSPQDKRRAERPDFPHVRRGVSSGVLKTRGGQKGGVSGEVPKASGGQKGRVSGEVPKATGGQKGRVSGEVPKATGGQQKGVSGGVPKTRGGKRGQGRKIRDGAQGASVAVAMGGARRGSQQPVQFAQFRQNACECRGLRPAHAASCRCLVRLSELSAGPAHAGRVPNQQDS